MTVIVKDTFNRADSTSLGTAETGQTWLYSNKPYGIRSGQAYLYLNGTTSFDSVAYIESGISDCKLTCTIATYQASNSRLFFRYTDFSNYLAIEPRATDIRIYKKIANTTTTIGTFAHTSASGDIISVEMTGSTIKVYVNGTLKTTVTIAEQTTATKHGIFANNTEAVSFDDFQVEDFNTGGTPITINAITANASANAISPSISANSNVNIASAVGSATANAPIPQVGSFTNITVNAVTGNATGSANVPNVEAVRNISVITIVPNATATMLAPNVFIVDPVIFKKQFPVSISVAKEYPLVFQVTQSLQLQTTATKEFPLSYKV